MQQTFKFYDVDKVYNFTIHFWNKKRKLLIIGKLSFFFLGAQSVSVPWAANKELLTLAYAF